MENVLTTLRKYNPNRLITMFGAGGNRPKVRRYEMGEISGKLSDISVITEDNSRFEDVMDIIEDIKTGLAKTDGKYIVVPNRRDAIRWCIENAQDGDIIVVDELKLSEGKTRLMAGVLKALKAEKKALVVLPERDENVVRATANLAEAKTSYVNTLNVYDILRAGKLVVTKAALESVEEVYAS